MKRIVTLLAVALILAAFATACGSKPEKIEIKPGEVHLKSAKASQTLKVEVLDKKGKPMAKHDPIEWASAKPEVATVSAAGVVSAVHSGSTTVTAKIGEVTTDVAVTVKIIKQVKVEPETLEVDPGEKRTLKASVWDDNGQEITDAKVTWSSNKPLIASVSEDGVVTAEKAGKSTIRAKFEKASGKCSVTVKGKVEELKKDDKKDFKKPVGLGKKAEIKKPVKLNKKK